MKRSRIEQETSVTFNVEEPEAILWTAWPPLQRKMSKSGIEPYRTEGEGRWYKIDKKLITIRTKRKMGLKNLVKSNP